MHPGLSWVCALAHTDPLLGSVFQHFYQKRCLSLKIQFKCFLLLVYAFPSPTTALHKPSGFLFCFCFKVEFIVYFFTLLVLKLILDRFFIEPNCGLLNGRNNVSASFWRSLPALSKWTSRIISLVNQRTLKVYIFEWHKLVQVTKYMLKGWKWEDVTVQSVLGYYNQVKGLISGTLHLASLSLCLQDTRSV